MKLIRRIQHIGLTALAISCASAVMAANSRNITDSRESITFIMGEDVEANNQYYTQAYNYYTTSEHDRTEYIVTHCRSLLEVKEYLEQYPPFDGQPWGRVNMVVHSNEWSDLGVSVIPEGPRASVVSIEEALSSGALIPTSDSILDQHSELMIYGCGLGRNVDLLQSLSLAFGGDGPENDRLTVRSSRYFIFYESTTFEGINLGTTRYMAAFYYARHKSFHTPKPHRLVRQLEQSYPTAKLDWEDALTRTEPRFPGDSYHYTFRVPLVWYVTYPDKGSRPVFETKEEQHSYVKAQQELMEIMENYGFDFNEFRWTVRQAYFEHEDGSKEPAIKIIGQCTIYCILQPITQQDPNYPELQIPVQPALNDASFYGIVSATSD